MEPNKDEMQKDIDEMYPQEPVADDTSDTKEVAEAVEDEKPKDEVVTDTKPEAKFESQPITSEPKPKKSKKALVFVVVLAIVLLLAAGAGAVWYFVFNKPAVVTNNGGTTQTNNPVITEKDPDLLKMITPTTGETWLATPTKLDPQGFFTYADSDQNSGMSVEYYHVGDRAGKMILLADVWAPLSRQSLLFEKSTDGLVSFISKPNGLAIYNEGFTYDVATKIVTDSTTRYDSLSMPNRVVIDANGTFVDAPSYGDIGSFIINTSSQATNPSVNRVESVVKQIGANQIIKYETTNLETGLTAITYSWKTPANTIANLGFEPLPLDMSSYNWTSGYSSTYNAKLRAIARGCGSVLTSVTRISSITDSDVSKVGVSGDGKVVYALNDQTNPLFVKAYDEYAQFYRNDVNNPVMTANDFANYHSLVLYKDVNGEWLVYVREDKAPAFGCAKPVVYLYPTTAQTVRVKVGADVKVSDPLYNPAAGWTAFAQPNGQLTVNGTQYSSLFWEGPGYGQYPEISGGVIVKQSDVIGTIRQQLAQQGLNATETNEFVAYWQDQIPNKPYVRLTWFNTAQMNQLAPLYISPKPDTMIRVFLDMGGMDSPISIPAQNLTSIPRNGFTVVEWGGLSSKKLY